MSEAHHDLSTEFPEHRSRIQQLKQSNGHFAQLVNEHHTVSKELHLINAQLETPSDDAVEALKRTRLRLKDEIYQMLRAEE